MSVGESKSLGLGRQAPASSDEGAGGLAPEVLDAAREVDASLLQWTLAMSPLERLRNAVKYGQAVARLRGGSA